MQTKNKSCLIGILLLIFLNLISAQKPVQLQSDLNVSGNITIGQDTSIMATAGMIRFDTVSNLFLGYNGTAWIDLGATGDEVNTQTDTLKIGDSYGGGIVFYTVGSNGLIVTDFDIPETNNILVEEISWGGNGVTNATDLVNGQQNTTAIIDVLENWTDGSGGSYAAKICDDLVLGGYSDWYLPSFNEFMLLNQNAGTEATINSANLESTVYWTSTELSIINAYFYRTSGTPRQGNSSKSSDVRVRAIRAY